MILKDGQQRVMVPIYNDRGVATGFIWNLPGSNGWCAVSVPPDIYCSGDPRELAPVGIYTDRVTAIVAVAAEVAPRPHDPARLQ